MKYPTKALWHLLLLWLVTAIDPEGEALIIKAYA